MRVLVCSLLTLSCFGANSRVLPFEARRGQYVSHGPGYALSVTSRGAVLNLNGHAIHLSVAGASPTSELEPLDRMPGKANYLFGQDVRASFDLYGRVRWHGVYTGIDVVFRGNQDHLEYDFEIGARRDPDRIRLAFEGIDNLQVNPHGDLVLSAGDVRIHQPQPIAYQVVTGNRVPVAASYWIDASNQVRFRTGAYDRGRPLVIDPQIVFDKSFGGSGSSTVAGLARDSQGALYVAGATNSPDFGTVNPFQSHLVTGPLLVTANAGQKWSYPIVGTATSVNAMAFAPSMPLVAYAATPTGVYKSADGGTTWTATAGAGLTGAPLYLAVDAGSATTLYAATAQGVFVSTNAGMSWQASTSGLSGGAVGQLTADPNQAGTVLVLIQGPPALFRTTDFGHTWAQLALVPPNLTIAPIMAFAFAPNGTIIAANYQNLFLSSDDGNTWVAGASQGVYSYNNQALAVAPGNPFTLYLISSGVQRSTDGGQTFNVVLPSVQTDSARLAVDPRNPSTVYVTDSNLLERSTDAGQTWSTLPLPGSVYPQSIVVSPADSRVFLAVSTQSSVFVTKWSADGSQVLYATYLGGSGGDFASAIAVDASGSAYITGSTYSPDFPTTAGAFQTKLIGAPDVFVAKLSPDGSKLIYSTLLGTQAPDPYTRWEPRDQEPTA